MNVTINGLSLTPDQLRHFLYRAFWKGTVNANLNTVPGCEQAAECALTHLSLLDESWDVSQMAEMPGPRKVNH